MIFARLFIISALVLTVGTACGPDLSRYASLKEPRLTERPRQKMMIIEMKGEPKQTAGPAIGKLYKTYYKIKGAYKDFPESAPLARWPNVLEADKTAWTGVFGLPVPEALTSIDDKSAEEEPKIQIVYWDYGDVAEILHIGSYATEHSTIRILHDFIASKGYEIAGPHEEEYLKGPGVFSFGGEASYQTIIRYAVRKKAAIPKY